jgi:hypothetical protein
MNWAAPAPSPQLSKSKGVNRIQISSETVYQMWVSTATGLHATSTAADESNRQCWEGRSRR